VRKIAFVLYTNQPFGVSYLGGIPGKKISILEKKLLESLGDKWDVTFEWEKSKKEGHLDALIIPDPFPPVLNEEKVFEVRVPAILFYEMNIDEIAKIIEKELSNESDAAEEFKS